MIELDNVSKKFNKKFLFKNLSFTFERGKTLIIGPNGIGKTTLLSMIYGMTKPSGGHIRCFGYDSISDFKNVKEIISYLPSEGQFPSSLRFTDIIDYALSYTSENCISFYLEKLKLNYLLKQQLRSMSSGEKRLCGIAFTLFSSKDVIIMDEPLVNVDKERQLIVTELIKSEKKDIILTTHQDDFIYSGNFHIVKIAKNKDTMLSEINTSNAINKIIRMSVTEPSEVSKILKNYSIDFTIKNDELILSFDPDLKVMDEIMKYIVSFRRSVDY